MPELQQISFEPAPEYRGEQAWREGLTHFTASLMPAVILRNAGVTTEEAITRLTDLAPEELTFDPGWNDRLPTLVRNTSDEPDTSDTGLHVDTDHPPHFGKKQLITHFHHTISGQADVRILSFAPDRIRDFWEPRHDLVDTQLLPPAAIATYKAGLFDPSRFASPALRTTVQPGDIIAFKEALPLAHDFISLGQEPRTARVVFAMLRVMPGVNVPRY